MSLTPVVPLAMQNVKESQIPRVKVIHQKTPDFIREVFGEHNILNFNIMDLKEKISFVVGSSVMF